MAGLSTDDQSNQDDLARLFGGMMPGDPTMGAKMGTPGAYPGIVPGAQPGAGVPRGAMPTTIPMAPAAAQPQPAALASDDPAITGQPATTGLPAPPKAPTLLRTDPSAVSNLTSKAATLATPLKRADYQPHWWERLAAVPLAAAEGFGTDPNSAARGAKAGTDFEWKRYNRAEEGRKNQLSGLDAQIALQEKAQAANTAANTVADEDYKNQGSEYDRMLKTEEANNTTKQTSPEPRIGPDGKTHYYKTRLGGGEYEVPEPAANLRDDEQRKTDALKPAPDAERVKHVDPKTGAVTFTTTSVGGTTIPYTPKNIEEGALLGDPHSMELYRQAHPGKESAGEKPATHGQFAAVEVRKQSALNKAEGEYSEAINGLDTMAAMAKKNNRPAPDDTAARAQALNELNRKKQQALDDYKEGVLTLGGSIAQPGEGGGAETAPAKTAPAAATPNATPATSASKHKVGDEMTLKGGQRVVITNIHADGKHFDYKPASGKGTKK